MWKHVQIHQTDSRREWKEFVWWPTASHYEQYQIFTFLKPCDQCLSVWITMVHSLLIVSWADVVMWVVGCFVGEYFILSSGKWNKIEINWIEIAAKYKKLQKLMMKTHRFLSTNLKFPGIHQLKTSRNIPPYLLCLWQCVNQIMKKCVGTADCRCWWSSLSFTSLSPLWSSNTTSTYIMSGSSFTSLYWDESTLDTCNGVIQVICRRQKVR